MTLAVGQANSGTVPPAPMPVGTVVTQPAPTAPAPVAQQPVANGTAGKIDACPEEKPKEEKPKEEKADEGGCFPWRLYKAYCDEFKPKKDDEPEAPPKPRRALPEPWSSPPLPNHEY